MRPLLLALLFGATGLRAQEVSTGTTAAVSSVRVRREAAGWEPVSVKTSSKAKPAATFFERKIRRIKGVYKGERSPARAVARLHPLKDGGWLVISVYPESLRPRRMHLEARFLIKKKMLENVKVAAVTRLGEKGVQEDDSLTWHSKGIAFEEEFPASAQVRLSFIDHRLASKAVNSGSVRLAAFGSGYLRFVSFGWSVTGLQAAR